MELYPTRPTLRFPPATTAVLTALVCLGTALGLRHVMNEAIGNALPFVTVFGATAAAQWYGGRYAAISVALLGLVGCVLMLPLADGRTRVDEVGGVLGIAAFLFTSALILVFGEVARAAQVAAHHRSETLRVTLHSIGDAVITTDMRGHITSLNAVAESLTGWAYAEAAGQPLDAVFRIVNENTRQPVDNPAAKALREGTVVGLANHTVLIRRDSGRCRRVLTLGIALAERQPGRWRRPVVMCRHDPTIRRQKRLGISATRSLGCTDSRLARG